MPPDLLLGGIKVIYTEYAKGKMHIEYKKQIRFKQIHVNVM